MSSTGSLVPPFPWELNTFPDHQHFPSGKLTTFHKQRCMHLLLIVAQPVKLYLTLCNPMDCSTPGFRDLHYSWRLLKLVSIGWWWHPTISSSVAPFSFCPQSFPASWSFPMIWPLASGGQSIGASASVSVLPMNIQEWFPLGLTHLISLQSKGLSRVFSNTTVQKPPILRCSAFFMVQLSHPYMTTGNTITLTRWTFVGRVMSLLFIFYFFSFIFISWRLTAF